MIHKQDILSLNYYNYKNAFTGSYDGMNYRIIKSGEKPEEVLKVWVWKGPYCFTKTSEEEKTVAEFPFSEDGIEQVIAWLNAQSENLQ